MTAETRLDYLVGVFGFLQISMKDVKLLDDKGRTPKKRNKMLMSEQDALAIYEWVGEQLNGFETHELRPKARRMDEAVKKLNNTHQTVNNFLLALMLLRAYIDNEATVMEQVLISPKINRLIEVVDGAVSDEVFTPEIKRTTWRTSDNLYRQYAGLIMLGDEVRDLKMKGIKR